MVGILKQARPKSNLKSNKKIGTHFSPFFKKKQ
jgi:hypothetical protein